MAGHYHRLWTSTQVLTFETFFIDVLNVRDFQNDAHTDDGCLEQGFTDVNRNYDKLQKQEMERLASKDCRDGSIQNEVLLLLIPS